MTWKNDIPVIDFANFTVGSFKERQECGEAILDAFKRFGFVYLSNAISKELIQTAFNLSKEFFVKARGRKAQGCMAVICREAWIRRKRP